MIRKALAVIAAVATLGVGGAAAAGATDDAAADGAKTGGWGRWCASSFDEAARLDMESFRDYDADTWRGLHHPAAQTVLASGQRFVGVDAIMTALAGHFEGREAIFEWTELDRFVDQTCTSGFVVYETRYRLPSSGFDQSATTTVTFVRQGVQWKVVFDQGTELPAG